MNKFAASLLALAMALAGCRTAESARTYRPTWARFYLETSDERASTAVLPRSGVRLLIGSRPVFTENDIGNIELVQVDLGKCLMFQLTPGATRDLYRLTGSNQGRRLVLMVNNEPLGARRIDGPLADGSVFIFVEVPEEALPELVTNLRRSSVALQHELARK